MAAAPVNFPRHQCEGSTNRGVPCRRFPKSGERYCWQHNTGLWRRFRAWTNHPVVVLIGSATTFLASIAGALAFFGVQLLPTTVLFSRTTGVLIAPESNDTLNLVKIGDSTTLLQSIRGERLDETESSFGAFDSTVYIWKKNGRYHVSGTIRDEQANVVLQITDNRWRVFPKSAFDWNYSATALEVKDNHDRIVFQLAFLPTCVEMQARLISGYGPEIGLYSTEPSKPAPLWLSPPQGNPMPGFLIRPIFEYPSDDNKGKLTAMGKNLVGLPANLDVQGLRV
jgi:hypothetical protein